MDTKKNKRGQNCKLKMNIMDHQMKQDQKNNLRNVNVQQMIMSSPDQSKQSKRL